jgi:flagellar motor switch protein FliG
MAELDLQPPIAANPLDGASAAAILLMLLSDDDAASILRNLAPNEVKCLGSAMFAVASANEQQVEIALDRFVDHSRKISALEVGAEPRIRGVMQAALGNVRADNMLAGIAPQNSNGALDLLRWMDTASVSLILKDEHPQVAALVLAALAPEVAAEVLNGLSDDQQADLVTRAARLSTVSADAVADLEIVLARYGGTPTTATKVRMGGKSDAAKIMSSMHKTQEERVLKSLKKKDKLLGSAIEDEMFIFDNLNDLDDKNLGTLLRSIDAAILTLALKDAPAPLAEKMLGCMSARAAQSIRDDMAETGPVKRADVEGAQKEILVTARALAADGTIMLGGKGDDYV